jgi:hypothetical protein
MLRSLQQPAFDHAQYVTDLGEACLGDQDGQLVMIRIYMDESGTHDGSPVVTVGAYFGRPKDWARFTKRWTHALGDLPYYHAADAQALRGPFEGWTETQRNELVIRLLKILHDSPFGGQAAGINMRDYDAGLAGKEHLKKMFGTSYGASFQWVVSLILNAVEHHGTNEALAFFHEENDFKKEAEEAFAWVKRNRRRHTGPMTLVFAEKAFLVPLQAADILAYEANKKLRNPEGKSRRSLEALDPSKEKISIRAFTKHNMDWLVRRMESIQEEVRVFGKPITFLPDDGGGGADEGEG